MLRGISMIKQELLNNFKKEFSEEIDLAWVGVDDLKKQKISTSALQAETKLHKVFGDEIYIAKKHEEKISGEKEIVKLSENDIAFDSKVREICDDLIDDEFDSKLTAILNKFVDGDE